MITGVGGDPPFESGVIAAFLEVHVLHSGKDEILYLPYMRKDQSKPTLGRTCKRLTEKEVG
jgi:hypothetical protein